MSELEQQDQGAETVGITDQGDALAGGDSEGAGGSQEQFFDVNGEKLTLQQLQEGYLRTSDYTRKTQELAEQRNTLKPYQEMEQYLKANPDKAQRIYQYLQGNNEAFAAEEVDPIKQELFGVKAQTQYMAQQLAAMERDRMLNEVNSDEKYKGMFKSPTFEKALLATHMQLGRKGHLRETAEEMYKEVAKRELDAEKRKEEIIKKNLSSATRQSSAGNKSMATPADKDLSSMDERALSAEALKMLG